MNKARRKVLSDLIERLGEILEALGTLSEEEQAAYDNLPESLQSGGRGLAMGAAAGKLYDAVSTLDDVRNELADVAGG